MIHPSDQEQIQIIKNWFKENGVFTITAIVLVLVVSYGWRFYQEKQVNKTAEASLIYEQVLNNVSNNQGNELAKNAVILTERYASTPYASMAKLLEAKFAVQNNKLDEAAEKLNWVVQHAKNSDVKQIARIRMARILLAQNNPDKALDALNKIDQEAYLSLTYEVRGDIYSVLGKKEEAKTSYQNALNNLAKNDPHYSFLQIKFDQLQS